MSYFVRRASGTGSRDRHGHFGGHGHHLLEPARATEGFTMPSMSTATIGPLFVFSSRGVFLLMGAPGEERPAIAAETDSDEEAAAPVTGTAAPFAFGSRSKRPPAPCSSPDPASQRVAAMARKGASVARTDCSALAPSPWQAGRVTAESRGGLVVATPHVLCHDLRA